MPFVKIHSYTGLDYLLSIDLSQGGERNITYERRIDIEIYSALDESYRVETIIIYFKLDMPLDD